MADLIDRQQAIDAIHEDADWLAAQGSDWQVERMERDKSILKSLPTVQPNHNAEPSKMEIIRCKDCKYSIDEYNDGDCYCKRPSMELVWIGKSWDFFCKAGAKRGGEAE